VPNHFDSFCVCISSFDVTCEFTWPW